MMNLRKSTYRLVSDLLQVVVVEVLVLPRYVGLRVTKEVLQVVAVTS